MAAKIDVGMNAESGYPQILILFNKDVGITIKMNSLDYMENFTVGLDSCLKISVILFLNLETITSLKQTRIPLRLIGMLLITLNNNKPRSSHLRPGQYY